MEDWALNSEAEALPDEPAGENDGDDLAEPAAEGEPGEGSESPVEVEPQYGPIPYDRFSEVVDERNQLRQQVQQLNTLAQDPEVLKAIQAANARVAGGNTYPPYQEPAEDPLALPEYMELSDEGEFLYGVLQKLMVEKLPTLESQLQSVVQYREQVAVQEANREAEAALSAIESEVGTKFNDTDKQSIGDYAVTFYQGAMARGKPLSIAEAVRMGFAAARPSLGSVSASEQVKRDAQVQAQKQRLSQGRASGVSGPQSNGHPPDDLTPEQAGEIAWNQLGLGK